MDGNITVASAFVLSSSSASVSPAKSIEYFMWGHTAEMINVLTVLQKDMLLSRIYVASATDNLSLQKSSGFGGQYDSRSTYT
ncbi:hypothetical protein NC653_006766 [Populus alba x Populus x berolinensis]|uniref:Uncharacterized protein n=1 Tax=Populus alba x Populus x berolinensis TaxID=444605 RepID=A0AAD6RFG0_9ROSI|nr:hypothetical protein NC653_006766 [Populus alba x Populus x berolinensis]